MVVNLLKISGSINIKSTCSKNLYLPDVTKLAS